MLHKTPSFQTKYIAQVELSIGDVKSLLQIPIIIRIASKVALCKAVRSYTKLLHAAVPYGAITILCHD